MADVINGTPINKLPAATTVADSDILVIENATKTQKIAVSTLREQLGLLTDEEYADLLKRLQ